MTLHPVLAEKLSAALEPALAVALTRRDARLPAVPGKVHAVIGMRRAGKTTYLRQLLNERRAALPPERAVYLSFDDDRLAGIELGRWPRSAGWCARACATRPAASVSTGCTRI